MDRMLRLDDLIGNPTAGRQGIIPISKTSLYKLVATGKFPPPVKLGRCSCWRASDVEAWLAEGGK